MSRVGLKPIDVPKGVDVKLEGGTIAVKGAKGQLTMNLFDEVGATLEDGRIGMKPADMSKRSRSLWGLQRSLVGNMITGVTEGFAINLEIAGVGYRAAVDGRTLKLQIGYSHDVEYAIPEGIEIVCERPTQVRISGIDKQKVGQVAAEIRAYRPPSPYIYKNTRGGMGIKYAGEYLNLKVGKKK